MSDENVSETPETTEAPPEPVGTHQVIPRITPWFAESFKRHSAPDEISWEIGLVQFPTETPGQFMGLIAVYAAIPGQVLNTVIMANQQIQPYNLDPDGIDMFVRRIIEGLRESRSQQSAAMMEQAAQAGRNGSRPSTGGLILPG